MPPTYHRGCWHVVSRGLLLVYRHFLRQREQKFTIRKPSSFTRRCCIRVSPIVQYSPLPVPMWPFNLSVRLLIVDLVGRYPTNYLIRREPIFQRIAPLVAKPCGPTILCGISVRFQTLSPSERQVAHALLTRPPLRIGRASSSYLRSTCMC